MNPSTLHLFSIGLLLGVVLEYSAYTSHAGRRFPIYVESAALSLKAPGGQSEAV